MENSIDPSLHNELTGDRFAQHVEACLASGAPVTLPGHGEYDFRIVPEQPGPPDMVYFEATRVNSNIKELPRDDLRHVIGCFSTAHAPLSMIIHPHTSQGN